MTSPTWINWSTTPVGYSVQDPNFGYFRPVTNIYGGANVDENTYQTGGCASIGDGKLKWLDANYYSGTGKVFLKYSSTPNNLWNMVNVTANSGKNQATSLAMKSSNGTGSVQGLYYNCNSRNAQFGGLTDGSSGQGQCINTETLVSGQDPSGDLMNNNWCYGNSGVGTGFMGLHDSKSGFAVDALLQSTYCGVTQPYSNPNMMSMSNVSKTICNTVSDPSTSFKSVYLPGSVTANYNPTPPPASTFIPDQLIDQDNAVNCCSLDSNTVSSQENPPVGQKPWSTFPMCSQAFNPDTNNSYSLCVPLMKDYCNKAWQGASPNIQKACERFISTSPSAPSYVSSTIENYITSSTRVPQNYISSKIYQQDGTGTTLSSQYYNYFTGGQAKAKYDGTDTLPLCKYDPNNPSISDSPFDACLLRDDSIDPFFKSILPNMINSLPNSQSKSTIYPVLDCFCAEFDRNDIESETDNGVNTLMNMCGCHLVNTSNPNQNISCPFSFNSSSLQQTESQYYNDITGGIQCDPMCVNASVTSTNGSCTTPNCIIDNVNYTCVNSKCGPININQSCPTGSCYISDVTLNLVNSSNPGGLNMSSSCGQCYSFTDNNLSNSTPIDCATGQPLGSSGGGGNSGSSGNWFQDHIWATVVIGFLVLLLLILLGWGIYKLV